MRAEPTGPRATPLDPSHAVQALEEASEREQIFELLLRAARSRMRFAALLSVHAEHLRGRRALADDGIDTAGVGALQIPRGAVPALEAAVDSGAPAVAPLATGEPFLDGLLEQLGGATASALILPLAIGRRTVALVVAHRAGAPLAEADVADLRPLVAASSPALARALAARSRASAPTVQPAPRAPTRAASEGYEIEVIQPAEEPPRRETLPELRSREAWEELAEALRERVREGMEGGEPDEDEQLTLLLELGRVEADRLLRPDRAIEALRGAQTIDAADARVLDALEALLVREARWAEAVALLEQRAALTDEPRARTALLANLAAIAREHLGDDERAAAAYERILAREPAHEAAGRELAEIYTAREQWQPLVALLLDRASREGAAGIETLEQVAQLYEDRLGDPYAALLVRITIARRDPDRPHLLEQLDRLAVRAAARAEPGAWDEITAEASALATELEAAHPEAAARVWNLIGRWLRDHAGRRADAARALERALRANPDDLDALTELPELLRADGRWAELIALLSRRADAAADPARRCELHAELGALYETELARPAEAIPCYERALADAPGSAHLLVELHRLYLTTEAWEALAELTPRLVEALAPTAPGAVIADLHAELGGILAERLDRPDDAVRAFRDALALDPRHAAARRGLAGVYEASGQTEELLDATEAELDAATRAEQLRRYGDVAAGWHELARYDRAAACWQKLVALDPRGAAARRGLARALRAGEQWPALAAAQRALLELVGEPAERIELSLELAAVLEDRFDDLAGATAAYQEVVGLDPDHRGALHALARLHEGAGRIQPALAALQRLLEQTTTDFAARADLLQRIGHVHLGARDAANARLSFAQAIALDRDSAPAHEGMARVHVQQGELVAAGEELVRAAQLAATPDEAIRCLADAAWLYRHRLGDAERAREHLHRILALDPEHADARAALAELLAETRQWQDLWPHLEQQVARARDVAAMPPAPPKERLELYARAARCAVELGRFPVAMELYDLACAIEARPALLLDRADALYRSTSLEAAAASYQTIAIQHAQALERSQLVGLYRRLAQIHTALGKPSQAHAFHQKVLDLEPRHKETLEDLIELNLARGRHDEAIAGLRSLAASLPAAERLPILERIGDLYRDKLANPARATSTYLEALELDAGNHRILQRLLDLQTDAGQWAAAVGTIDRFLTHEADPARRGSYFLASAEIRRTELRDRAGAIACYEEGLDALLRPDEGPPAAAVRARALGGFGALTDLLAAEQSWQQLEQAYRRMIKRLPKDDPALVQLWHALGEVHRTLEHPQTAIEAFEVAHSLDPDKSPQRARLLAELYARTGAARPAETTGRAAKLVGLDPTNPDAYRALGRTSLEAGRIDEAWCVSRALVFLEQATPEETALYRRHKAHEVKKAKGILDEDAWAYVRHPDEDRVISAIFALIWEAAVAGRAGPPKTFELRPKERMPIEEGAGVIAKIFRHAARVLNVPLPDVYVQSRRSGRLLLANVVEKGRLAPTIIVGRDLMTGYRDTEIAASVGTMLALLRPAYYLKLALPGVDELETVLAAAGRLAGRRIGRAALEPAVSALAPELQKRATRPVTEALGALAARLPEAPDLARWRAAVDAAAQRAGLLVSGELAATARMLSTDAALAGGGRPSQRIADLVGYSVSPGYFTVRRHLGVAVA